MKNLSIEELETLCSDLRNFIIDQLSNNPGHFGSSLGTVELTVALHYVYNTPYDRIVWDVAKNIIPEILSQIAGVIAAESNHNNLFDRQPHF